MKKENSRDLHHEAMNIAEDSFFLKRAGKTEEFKEKQKEAFYLEHKAAMQLLPNPAEKVEPTRSILFRSAGWMALHAELYLECKQCILLGLECVIHSDIKEELMELREELKKVLPSEDY